jgi:hypothetical protein
MIRTTCEQYKCDICDKELVEKRFQCYDTGKIFKSIGDAGRYYGVTRQYISFLLKQGWNRKRRYSDRPLLQYIEAPTTCPKCVKAFEKLQNESHEGEEWKQHPQYTTCLVSNKGRIARFDKAHSRMRIPLIKKTVGQYQRTSVEGNLVTLHRLVGETWIANRSLDSHEVINHLDSEPSNNVLENLEVTTAKGNAAHRDQTRGAYTRRKGVPIKCNITNREFPSIKAASRELNINHLTIKKDLRRGTMKYGRHFSYL